MRSWSVLREFGWLLVLFWLSRMAAAEEIEPLPADFLEYLASFESDEEDWLLFQDKDSTETKSEKPNQRPKVPAPPAKTAEKDKP